MDRDIGSVETVGKDSVPARGMDRVDPGAWVVPAAVVAAASLAIVLLYLDTFRSIVAIWSRSGTYAHGFFILPIALYIAWDDRERLAGLTPRPSYWVAALLPLLGFGWLACRLAGVLVLEQYCAVAMLPVVAWTVLGTRVARALAFPLGFVLLGVPVGEALIPPLIDYTATFTVAGLRLTGVPVLREGNFLTLPTGQWSVVEACSGLRYLIASITLGFLYAHLMYRTWLRWGLCILASVAVPLVANWMRAYMIVMIGHLSNMTLAVGIDHLIYGWLFFGVVILIFTWIGSFFREPPLEAEPEVDRSASPDAVRPMQLVPAAVAVVVLAAVWPAWGARIDRTQAASTPPSAETLLPASIGAFAPSDPVSSFRPHYVRPAAFETRWYRRGDLRVGLSAACYVTQRQGAELVSSSNRLIRNAESGWRQVERRTLDVGSAEGRATVHEAGLEGAGGGLLVWSWYWVDGDSTASPYRVKLRELTAQLAGQAPLSCGLHAFTPGGANEPSRERLGEFLEEALPAVDRTLSAPSPGES